MGFKRKLVWTTFTLSVALIGRWLHKQGQQYAAERKLKAPARRRRSSKSLRQNQISQAFIHPEGLSRNDDNFPLKGSLKESFGEPLQSEKESSRSSTRSDLNIDLDFESNLTPPSPDRLH
jgi:hypothetical protein